MTAGRVIDLGVARARLRGEGWAQLEGELTEVPDPHEVCSPEPGVCAECETGGLRHTDDCSRAEVLRTGCGDAPVLTLAPPAGPLQLQLDEEGA